MLKKIIMASVLALTIPSLARAMDDKKTEIPGHTSNPPKIEEEEKDDSFQSFDEQEDSLEDIKEESKGHQKDQKLNSTIYLSSEDSDDSQDEKNDDINNGKRYFVIKYEQSSYMPKFLPFIMHLGTDLGHIIVQATNPSSAPCSSVLRNASGFFTTLWYGTQTLKSWITNNKKEATTYSALTLGSLIHFSGEFLYDSINYYCTYQGAVLPVSTVLTLIGGIVILVNA